MAAFFLHLHKIWKVVMLFFKKGFDNKKKNCIHEIFYYIVFRVSHQILLFIKPLFQNYNLTMESYAYIHCHKLATIKMKCDFTCYTGNMVDCSIYKIMLINFELLKNKKQHKNVFWWCGWHNVKNMLPEGKGHKKNLSYGEYFCSGELNLFH